MITPRRAPSRLLRAAAALLLTLGCTPRPTPAVAPVVVPVAGEGATPRASVTKTSPSVKCSLVAPDWSGRDTAHLGLRFRAADPVVAVVASGALTVRIERTSKLRIHATAASGGFEIAGAVAPDDLALFATRPLRLAGVVVPGPDRILELATTGKPSTLSIRYEYDEDAFVEEPVGCQDLGLMPGDFDPIAGLVDDAKADAVAIVADTVAVAPTAGGAATVVLAADVDPETYVVERLGNRARIVWPRVGDVVVGWVDAAALGDVLHHRIGLPYGAGGLGLAGMGRSPATVCDHALVLFGEIGGERRRMGTIAPDTELDVIESENGFAIVEGRDTGIYAAEDAALGVESAALTGCQRP